jgi:hypothetical protein
MLLARPVPARRGLTSLLSCRGRYADKVLCDARFGGASRGWRSDVVSAAPPARFIARLTIGYQTVHEIVADPPNALVSAEVMLSVP